MKTIQLFFLLMLVTLITFACKVKPPALPSGGYTFNGGVPVQNGNPVGLNQATLILYVRASDDATSAANRTALRTSEQAELATVNTFFGESSFSRTSFNYTHAPQTGWYDLPDSYDDYMWTPADITNATNPAQVTQATDNQDLVQDFTDFFTHSLQEAVDDGFNVANFTQVCVVVIGPFHRGTSYGSSNFTLQNNNGNNFQVSLPVVVVSTNTGWSRTAHEFGHAFGKFTDLYVGANRRMQKWDIMDCTYCTNQTSGWHKDAKAGWYQNAQLKTISRPIGTTQIVDNTTLVPLEKQNPSSTEVQAIKLDVGGGLALYVENRQQTAGQVGSQLLPANGIIVSDAIDVSSQVNASRPSILLFGGPITSGNSFTDQSYGSLQLEVTGTAPNLNVKTTWGPDPYFDLVINPWNPSPWESEDIWIDSQANGWGTYEFSNPVLNPNVTGNPIRNGDRPWVGNNNRVYARVHNTGTTDASNVQVSFYLNTPQGIGGSGNWSLLERKTIPLVAAGTSVVTPAAIWRPNTTNATHTCLQVKIDIQPGELNANNNEAQENVNDFNTSTASPWKKYEGSVDVSNPTNRYQDIRLEMTGLPENWTGWISDRIVSLAPNKTKEVDFIIDPNGGNPDGNKKIEFGLQQDIDIVGWLLNVDDDIPYGGITTSIHAVRMLKDIRIVDYPEDDFSLAEIKGQKPIVVSLSPGFETQVTLQFVSKSTGESQVAFSRSNSTSNSNSRALFYLDRIVQSQEVSLTPNEEYNVTAFIYGEATIGSDIQSNTVIIKPR